jgi:hypothetical protein
MIPKKKLMNVAESHREPSSRPRTQRCLTSARFPSHCQPLGRSFLVFICHPNQYWKVLFEYTNRKMLNDKIPFSSFTERKQFFGIESLDALSSKRQEKKFRFSVPFDGRRTRPPPFRVPLIWQITLTEREKDSKELLGFLLGLLSAREQID